MYNNMTKGVILIAGYSFVIGAIFFSLMIYTLTLEEQFQTIKDKSPDTGNNVSLHLHHAFGLHLDKTSIDLIVSFILLLSLMMMIFSILLVIGIKKNKPSLVVAYFSFSSLVCVLLLVSALLELLEGLWRAAIITCTVAFIMIERLSVVYSVYEDMEKHCDSNLLLEEDGLYNQEPIDNISSE